VSDTTQVQRFFPPNRLADKLQKASPRTTQECLQKAGENLQQITGACANHAHEALSVLEAGLAAWPGEPDNAYLESLYQMSMRIVGVASVAGLPDLDRAAKSLCDVVDGLIAKSLWERDPIEVHVAAMRLLKEPAALGGGAGAVVDGLLQVRKRFAVPPPPPKKKG
jgi:hypothetical protein